MIQTAGRAVLDLLSVLGTAALQLSQPDGSGMSRISAAMGAPCTARQLLFGSAEILQRYSI